MASIEQEELWAAQLKKSREMYKAEMRRALLCRTADEKRKCAADWKAKYSETTYNELIRCAKNKQVAAEICNWNF